MKVYAIALNTFREAIRNKVLYSIIFFAFVVVAIAAAFGSVSLGDQMKFVKDFSLMAISIFGVVMAVVLGVNLLHKELGMKTIINILSKPVGRWQFVVGKFLGLFATVALVVALMTTVLVLFITAFEDAVDWGLILAGYTALLELVVIIAVALFFSAVVVTPTLAGLFTVATFIAGRSSAYLQYFFGDEHPESLRAVTHVLYWLLPHLDRFNIADQVVYGEFLSMPYLLSLTAYSVAYAALLLLITVGLFSRREFT